MEAHSFLQSVISKYRSSMKRTERTVLSVVKGYPIQELTASISADINADELQTELRMQLSLPVPEYSKVYTHRKNILLVMLLKDPSLLRFMMIGSLSNRAAHIKHSKSKTIKYDPEDDDDVNESPKSIQFEYPVQDLKKEGEEGEPIFEVYSYNLTFRESTDSNRTLHRHEYRYQDPDPRDEYQDYELEITGTMQIRISKNSEDDDNEEDFFLYTFGAGKFKVSFEDKPWKYIRKDFAQLAEDKPIVWEKFVTQTLQDMEK